jgi:ankyrin repeat protein
MATGNQNPVAAILIRILQAAASSSPPETRDSDDNSSNETRARKRTRSSDNSELSESELNPLAILCAATNPFVSETTVRTWLDEHPEDLSRVGMVGGRKVSPLHAAIDTGNISLVRLLLELGADRLLADGCGKLPIHHALATDNVVVLKLLLQYDDVRATVVGSNLRKYGPCTVLEYAMGLGKEHGMNTLRELLCFPGVDVNHRSQPFGTTPLTMALMTHNVCGLLFLLAHPDFRFDKPSTAPIDDGFECPLITAMAYEWPSAVIQMLERGASPDVRGSSGLSFREILYKPTALTNNHPITVQLRSLVGPPLPEVAPSA